MPEIEITLMCYRQQTTRERRFTCSSLKDGMQPRDSLIVLEAIKTKDPTVGTEKRTTGEDKGEPSGGEVLVEVAGEPNGDEDRTKEDSKEPRISWVDKGKAIMEDSDSTIDSEEDFLEDFMTSNYDNEDGLLIEQLEEEYNQREEAENGRVNEEEALDGVATLLGEGSDDMALLGGNGMSISMLTEHINANLHSNSMF